MLFYVPAIGIRPPLSLLIDVHCSMVLVQYPASSNSSHCMLFYVPKLQFSRRLPCIHVCRRIFWITYPVLVPVHMLFYIPAIVLRHLCFWSIMHIFLWSWCTIQCPAIRNVCYSMYLIYFFRTVEYVYTYEVVGFGSCMWYMHLFVENIQINFQ